MRALNILIFLCLVSAAAIAQTKDSLEAVISRMPDDTSKVAFLLKSADDLMNNEPERAFLHLTRAEKMAEQLGYIKSQPGILKVKGDYFRLKSDFSAAAKWYQAAADGYTREGDLRSAHVCINQVSSCLYETGNYPESRKISMEVLSYANSTGDRKLAASSQMRIANTYREEGDFRQSIDHTLKAASVFEELKEKKPLAQAYNNVATDFKDLKEFETALKYYEQSLEIKKEIADRKSIAVTYSNMGNLYRNMNRFKKALEYLNISYSMRVELGDKKGISQDLQNIGIVYRNLKDYDKALNYYNRSLELKREINDRKGEAIVHYNSAQVYFDKEEYNLTLQRLDMAEPLAREVNTADLLSDVFSLRSQAMEKMNNQREALENLKKSVNLRDSLLNMEKMNQILELQTKYESERKDRELLQKNFEIQKSKADLERQTLVNYLIILGAVALVVIVIFASGYYRQRQKLERQKAIESTRASIAGDLHDDVGATLSSIHIFSKLAQQKLHEKPEEVSAILERISRSTQDTMNNMSDLVWSIKPDNDEYENLSFRIKNTALELLEPAGIHYVIEDTTPQGVTLPMKARKNIFLIVKEAINNIVKYSEASEVVIRLSGNHKNRNLEITDNGKGFKLPIDGPGNGLKNMKARAEECGGELIIQSAPESGTVIKALFRLDKINY